MDSIQEFEKVQKRIDKLQEWHDLDDILQAELDDLITKANDFKEKLLNFD